MSTLPTHAYDFYSLEVDHEHLVQSTFYADIQQMNTFLSYSKKEIRGYNLHENAQYVTHISESTLAMPEHSYAPEAQSRSAQYAHPDMSINKPLSWPMDIFYPAGGEAVSDPSSPLTPDLLYTSSATGGVEETHNVFDVDFGAAIDSTNSFAKLEHASHESRHIHFQVPESASSSRSYSSMPVRRRPRRSPVPTLSPHSETGSDSDHRRKFLCPLPGCERRFTSQYTLKVHMEAHKPKPKVSYPCTHGCSERFSRQHDRLRHEVAKHGKVCEFSCDACGRFFSSSKTLGNHKCP